MRLKLYRCEVMKGHEITLYWGCWSLTLMLSFTLLLEREEGGNVVWTSFRRNDP